jgi:hypothetical protein
VELGRLEYVNGREVWKHRGARVHALAVRDADGTGGIRQKLAEVRVVGSAL